MSAFSPGGGDKVLTGEVRRFLIAGLFNTALSYAIYAACLTLGMAYPVANFIAMIGGVLVSFLMQGGFVFRRLEARRFPAYVVLWLVLWLLNVGLITLFLPVVGGNAYLAGGGALIIVVVISFVVQKHFVFAGRSGR